MSDPLSLLHSRPSLGTQRDLGFNNLTTLPEGAFAGLWRLTSL